ncbi:tRNA-dihydrouridine synthase [Xylona heveae TC161]|uniref:tRNA-dihydrouridine(20a/20b) synthase [NAD(P)+] n=1 Tax=Xylona heveae (strain CBS 132557 / TC161) TaxID=1328760 RepID=A0A165A0I4_XYLHT|nr:tRNA-dihydrouridine synthase [Xylona heveae TC161]KZF19777.1 tRNA-dihydrouridine synthase [Xylona heveae TC161]
MDKSNFYHDLSDESAVGDPGLGPRMHPLKVFDLAKSENRPVHISAPMVRYSKLPFRALVRDYGVDICYTPMILAKEFNRSIFARDSDFTTNEGDRPLVVQFGASSPLELARAAEFVKPYCDGIDLNCGCPQSWACQEGIGSQLMHEKENVYEMVKAVKERCGRDFCVSVKIRVHADLRETVDFVKTVQEAGVDYFGCHGRRRSQKSSEPVNLDAIKLVKENTRVPVVANGDAFSMADVSRIAEKTGVDGVMSARGLLANPALFAGYDVTPWSAVERFMNYAVRYPIPFKLVLHHLSEMTVKLIGKKEKQEMLAAEDMLSLIDWLDDRSEMKRDLSA